MDRVNTYTVRLHKAEEGGYVVTVPALPGCHTHGETYDEALIRAKEAISGFVETLHKMARPIPVEGHLRTLHLQVRLPALA